MENHAIYKKVLRNRESFTLGNTRLCALDRRLWVVCLTGGRNWCKTWWGFRRTKANNFMSALSQSNSKDVWSFGRNPCFTALLTPIEVCFPPASTIPHHTGDAYRRQDNSVAVATFQEWRPTQSMVLQYSEGVEHLSTLPNESINLRTCAQKDRVLSTKTPLEDINDIKTSTP